MTVDQVMQGVVLPKIRDRVRRSILMNFRLGGRPAWIPSLRSLGEHTSKMDGKSRQGKTLVDTGILQNSIIVKITGEYEITAGTSVEYARIHNEGGTISMVVQVKAHSRLIRQAFGRSIPEHLVQVKAHNRQVRIVIPKREFLTIQPEDQTYFLWLVDDSLKYLSIGD